MFGVELPIKLWGVYRKCASISWVHTSLHNTLAVTPVLYFAGHKHRIQYHRFSYGFLMWFMRRFYISPTIINYQFQISYITIYIFYKSWEACVRQDSLSGGGWTSSNFMTPSGSGLLMRDLSKYVHILYTSSPASLRYLMKYASGCFSLAPRGKREL